MIGYLFFWGILCAVMVIAELLTLQLVSIWFAVGAIGAFFMAFSGFDFTAQLAVFVIVSIALLLVTRPLLRSIRVNRIAPMNADKGIGETAVVIEQVDPAHGTGRARTNGVDWIAISETGEVLPVDTIVRITSIDGAKLIVRRDWTAQTESAT